MLKFKDPKDREQFLTDIGADDQISEDGELSPEICEIFFKKNKQRTKSTVDFKKSQMAKKQWRNNKWNMMKGINKFHKSIEGKRFHRSLGRFLATRIFDTDKLSALPSLRAEAATAVSSVKTHLYIESQYYRPLIEDVDFEVFMEYALPLLRSAERKIHEDDLDGITANEFELLFRVTDFIEIKKAVASFEDGDSLIQSIETDLSEEARTEETAYTSFIEKICGRSLTSLDP